MSEHPLPGRPRGEAGPGAFDRDLNVKAIWVTVAGLAALVVVSMLLMWWLAQGLKGWELATDPEPSPLAEEARGQRLPPAPRLQGAPGSAYEERQGAPELELEAMRAAEDRALAGYGWADEGAGTARIPIERAIDILAARGDLGTGGPPSGTPGAHEHPADAQHDGAESSAEGEAGGPDDDRGNDDEDAPATAAQEDGNG